jgi:catechol 2,3-dioxygenase-like lactoylglutathione lyase family enzyme
MEKRVTGIGGIFFKAKDPKAMYAWYEKHLGMKQEPVVDFPWKDAETGEDAHTYWSLFKQDTKYLEPSSSSFMINYRVADMDAVVSALEADGIKILGRQDDEYGRFAWIMDPEGNKIELWAAPKEGT